MDKSSSVSPSDCRVTRSSMTPTLRLQQSPRRQQQQQQQQQPSIEQQQQQQTQQQRRSKSKSPTSPPGGGKLKSAALQQQQAAATSTPTPTPTATLHQFRAPAQQQQSGKHKSNNNNSGGSSGSNKAWSKRQHKTGGKYNASACVGASAQQQHHNHHHHHHQQQQQQQQQLQQQQQQLQQQQQHAHQAANGSGVGVAAQTIAGAGVGTLPTAAAVAAAATAAAVAHKADLENIQNIKNQISGHAHSGIHHGGVGHHSISGGGSAAGIGSAVGSGNHHHHQHNHNTRLAQNAASTVGNGLTMAAMDAKLGHGHGLKGQQQLYKKMLTHRGHHHHVLCAGNNANHTCCLVTGCNGSVGSGAGKDTQSNKDTSSLSGNSSIISGSAAAAAAANAVHYCCGRSKFFLPEKRLRKEVIVPPTKFLLGGNISDPLNLNSLQHENTSNASSSNNTPATTPRQSPITTPPKVEVIIPPNIHDPLHLLDPVDSMEYEKQLTSPMKRGGMLTRGSHLKLLQPQPQHHRQHRTRKNRKRRRFDSNNTSYGGDDVAASIDGIGETSTLSISLDDSQAAVAAAAATAAPVAAVDIATGPTTATVAGGTAAALIAATTTATVATTATSPVAALSATLLSEAAASASVETMELVQQQAHVRSRSPQAAATAMEETTTPALAAGAQTLSSLEQMECNVVRSTASSSSSTSSPLQPQQQHVATVAEPPNSGDNNNTLAVAEGAAVLATAASNSSVDLVLNAATLASTSAATLAVASTLADRRALASRDLRLDLDSTCYGVGGTGLSFGTGSAGSIGSGGGGGRKRKISESNNSQKSKKFHRHDAMDKIVSPVVPQPGAWKRPPRILQPMGARKPNTRRSTSFSETEQLSPVEELPSKPLIEVVEIPRDDTPELSEHGLGSPMSTTSAATSHTAGEPEVLTADEATASGAGAGVGAAAGASLEAVAATAAAITTFTEASGATVATEATGTAETTLAAVSAQPVVGLMLEPALIPPLGQKLPKFRPDGPKYRYGNFDRYVDFRQLNEFRDVRLQVFERHSELFENKDILDIGCNVGHMTITVARHLAPKSILGIDIDRELVARARRNLSIFVRIPKEEPKLEVKQELPFVQSTPDKLDTSDSNAHKKTRRGKKRRKAKQQQQQQQQQQQLLPPHLHHHHHHHHQHQHQVHSHNHHHHHHHHHHNHHHHQHLSQQQQLEMQQQQKLDALLVKPHEFFPISFPLTYGGIPNLTKLPHLPPHPTSGKSPVNTFGINQFPQNVFFRQTNYVLKDESLMSNDTQQYDLILCLSVTKWIHLNFGDAGLKLAFKRIFNQLRPGGKLILEAQNWASYKKKKNLTPDIYNNYKQIEFFPHKFHEYLLSSEVGFSHSYTLGVPRHMSKGFCRPIQLYAKGDYTPNHVRWSDAYYPQTPYEAYRGIYATLPAHRVGGGSSSAGGSGHGGHGAQHLHLLSSSTRSQNYDTPHYAGSASGSASCRQTPMYQHTYNPLETDSYQPSYDMEYLNHMYVFASPLYQTVWSPPASLRKSSSHTPVFGSVREAELDGDGSIGAGGSGGGSYHRHVYPPNDDTCSPNANACNAFNSIRDADTDDSNQLPGGSRRHVYATNCGESSSSPQVNHHEATAEFVDALMDDEQKTLAAGSGAAYCDLSDA